MIFGWKYRPSQNFSLLKILLNHCCIILYLFYQVNVRVADKGIPSLFDDAIVTINIDRKGLPRFELPEYVITIPEEKQVKSDIITVKAIDPRPSVGDLQSEIIYEAYARTATY